MTDTRGGWTLHLTCPCGTTGTYDAVVPSLIADAATRDGWWVDGGAHVRPHEHRDGICPRCMSAGNRGAA